MAYIEGNESNMDKSNAPNSMATFRDRFLIADSDVIYLDGNSLGRLPVATIERMRDVVENQWGNGLIGSWNKHWLEMVKRTQQKIATLINADPDEVLIADSTSVNLYKLVHGYLHAFGKGREVLTDNANFPSDLYILQGLCNQAREHTELKVVDVLNVDLQEIEKSIKQNIHENTKLVVLSHVHYQSGYAYDMGELNRVSKAANANVIWDVSHSVGVMPIDVKKSGCDMLVGCCYKYLNGGPGAPAFLYVSRHLQSQLRNPIQGWFGAAQPFAFSPGYEPSAGIEQFAVGTPNVLSLAAIEPGIDLVLEAGIQAIRQRSVELTESLIRRVDSLSDSLGLSIATPRDSRHRGSHVSVKHDKAWQITQSLIHDFKVIPDYREPNLIRFGINPLYNSDADIARAVDALKLIVQDGIYQRFRPEKSGVT